MNHSLINCTNCNKIASSICSSCFNLYCSKECYENDHSHNHDQSLTTTTTNVASTSHTTMTLNSRITEEKDKEKFKPRNLRQLLKLVNKIIKALDTERKLSYRGIFKPIYKYKYKISTKDDYTETKLLDVYLLPVYNSLPRAPNTNKIEIYNDLEIFENIIKDLDTQTIEVLNDQGKINYFYFDWSESIKNEVQHGLVYGKGSLNRIFIEFEDAKLFTLFVVALLGLNVEMPSEYAKKIKYLLDFYIEEEIIKTMKNKKLNYNQNYVSLIEDEPSIFKSLSSDLSKTKKIIHINDDLSENHMLFYEKLNNLVQDNVANVKYLVFCSRFYSLVNYQQLKKEIERLGLPYEPYLTKDMWNKYGYTLKFQYDDDDISDSEETTIINSKEIKKKEKIKNDDKPTTEDDKEVMIIDNKNNNNTVDDQKNNTTNNDKKIFLFLPKEIKDKDGNISIVYQDEQVYPYSQTIESLKDEKTMRKRKNLNSVINEKIFQFFDHSQPFFDFQRLLDFYNIKYISWADSEKLLRKTGCLKENQEYFYHLMGQTTVYSDNNQKILNNILNYTEEEKKKTFEKKTIYLKLNPVGILEQYESVSLLFHEIGHVVLGHFNQNAPCNETDDEAMRNYKNIKELEAESVAFFCLKLIGYEVLSIDEKLWNKKMKENITYIKTYYNKQIPDKSFKRIMNAVQKIIQIGLHYVHDDELLYRTNVNDVITIDDITDKI